LGQGIGNSTFLFSRKHFTVALMQLEITKGSPQRNGCEIIFRNLANSKIIIIQETTNPQPRHTFEIHLDCGLIQEEDDSVYVSMITSGVEGCIAYICRGMWVEK